MGFVSTSMTEEVVEAAGRKDTVPRLDDDDDDDRTKASVVESVGDQHSGSKSNGKCLIMLEAVMVASDQVFITHQKMSW
jgi:hypothetical protein